MGYLVRNNGEGCGNLTVSENECRKTAAFLGFDSSMGYETVDYGHLPHGCFVGHAHTDWKYTYFNVNSGTTNNGLKSICRNPYSSKFFQHGSKCVNSCEEAIMG